MSLVIGIDPGGTTGLAAVGYDFQSERYRLRHHIGAGWDPANVVHVVGLWAKDFGTDVWWIAAERFVVSRRSGRSKSADAGQRARDILGALEAAFPKRVKLRNAGAMKAWNAGDRRINAAGIMPTQGRPHTRDAAGHALMFHVDNLGNPDPLSLTYGARP
jgi:hypothetical protein